MTLPEQEPCPTRPLLLYRADVVFLALAPATFSFSMVRTPDSYDCLLKGCSQGAGLVLHTSENGPVRVGLVGGGRSHTRTLLPLFAGAFSLANREKYREFRVFWRFELRPTPRKPAPRADLQPLHLFSAHYPNRELTGNISGN